MNKSFAPYIVNPMKLDLKLLTLKYVPEFQPAQCYA